MGYFNEIIFPPLPQKIVSRRSEVVEETFSFEYWIVANGNNSKCLIVKCPICFHTYNLFNTYDEKQCRETLEEYEPFYYRRVIRECPKHSTHLEIDKRKNYDR